MKEAAEAVLRELPSVIGACVREDTYGHPREVHLLVRAGPNLRHLAYDVRELLEERLGVPVDQRVISIAQLADGREPGPLLAASSGLAAAAELTPETLEPEETATSHTSQTTVAAPPQLREPRMQFQGISTEAMESRVRIAVSLSLGDDERVGEALGLDTAPARLRAVAAAALKAVDSTCIGRARFEVEHTAVISAFERDYVLVSVLASSPYLGRRPIPLVGAQPVEMDAESAAALATLKAVNRTLSLVLRLPDSAPHPRSRPRHS
ncbi:hypothetical protein BH23GEM9_BH23GEM9_11530 [soil metagenome]